LKRIHGRSRKWEERSSRIGWSMKKAKGLEGDKELAMGKILCYLGFKLGERTSVGKETAMNRGRGTGGGEKNRKGEARTRKNHTPSMGNDKLGK